MTTLLTCDRDWTAKEIQQGCWHLMSLEVRGQINSIHRRAVLDTRASRTTMNIEPRGNGTDQNCPCPAMEVLGVRPKMLYLES